MIKTTRLLLFSLIVLLGTACSSSGLSSYNHGDYYRACYESIDKLKANAKNEKAQFVLTKSYPLAQKAAIREIDNAQIANEKDKYDILVNQYNRMNQLADYIYSCPKAIELIPQPTEYRAELTKAKQMAAKYAYERGIDALNAGTIEQARLAYNYFVGANNYVNGYSDVLDKINEARYNSTLRVIVEKPAVNANFQYSADFFYKNLMAELNNFSQNKFIRFYTQDDAYNENMKDPHQFIVLDFQNFSVGNVRESSNTIDLKRDSVVVGTVTVEGKTYNSYNTVNARLTTYRREISTSGYLNLMVVDARSNTTLQQRNFNGSYVWTSTWADFKGDDRALTREQKELCNLKPQIPPSYQDMFIEFTKPIFNQTVPFLRSVYNQF